MCLHGLFQYPGAQDKIIFTISQRMIMKQTLLDAEKYDSYTNLSSESNNDESSFLSLQFTSSNIISEWADNPDFESW